jgi:hypothetical protein
MISHADRVGSLHRVHEETQVNPLFYLLALEFLVTSGGLGAYRQDDQTLA